MGFCLNSKMPLDNYARMAASAFFVDKTRLLTDLIPIVEDPLAVLEGDDLPRGGDIRYVCITRPRRFGKTVMAHMIASFFGKNSKSRDLFSRLEIGSHPRFDVHAGRHNVIFLSLNEMPRKCKTYDQFIDRVQDRLLRDLREGFPDVYVENDSTVWDAFRAIYEQEEDAKFIFVLDEWDFIFHRNFVTDQDRIDYITFLSNLLKDQPYVEMAYMTGILPIAKYSSGSELNMFCEYTMANEAKFSDCFGFTETEVDRLYAIYESLGKVGREQKNMPETLGKVGREQKNMPETLGKVGRKQGNMPETLEKADHEQETLQTSAGQKVTREDKAGIGFVDFIFYPRNPSDDGLILELKVDDTPENAVAQIKEKKYALAFRGKAAEPAPYTGRILAVGIGYDKKDKKHHCVIEEL